MTANRKADLQRKLTLAPVAKPPAGLAERIKKEIPKDLRFNAETERERLSKAVAFNLRVAASILILVSSAYLGLRFLSQIDEKQQATPVAQRPPAAAIPDLLQKQQPAATTDTMVANAKEEAQVPAKPAAPIFRDRRVAKANRKPDNIIAFLPPPPPPPAPAPVPPPAAQAGAAAPAAPAVAETITVSKAAPNVAMDQVRAEKKMAARADEETTTSPVSGKEMRYTAKDKNVEIVTSKLSDEKLTPWSSVSPDAKQKILEAELAAGGDRKVIARIAREAGLIKFADSIEKR